MVSFCPEMLVVNRHVTNNVSKQVNNVTFFPNKLKSRETFANFISFLTYRHVLDLIMHKKKIKNLRVSFGGVSPIVVQTFSDVKRLIFDFGQ